MLGQDQVLNLLREALSLSTADQTEVVFSVEDSALTRFANSVIHQNVAESNTELRVRVVFGQKIGVATINELTREALKKVVQRACTIAQLQRPNPDFISLPRAEAPAAAAAFVARTAQCAPEERSEAVRTICRRAQEGGLLASGAFTTAQYEVAVANSLGVEAYTATTLADISTVLMSDDSSGYAAQTSLDVAHIDAEALAAEAVGKAQRSRHPTDLEEGEYEVLLDAYATADLLEHLALLGLGAKALQEGTSFLCGKLGQKIAGENITVWDDGLDPVGLPMPFDFEGVPKQKAMLIEKGIAQGVVYDSLTASKENKSSTGHALPAPNPYGPIPFHMFMRGGEATKEEMLKSMKRGLWVTRFWYTRPVHPLTVVVTGMTRDGTFLVENGQITRPIKNLRYTQGYLEALNNVEALSKETKLVKGEVFGAFRVPALKISRWRFQGGSLSKD